MDTHGGGEFTSDFDGLMELVARLREPDGCPWDREQTRRSMRHYILEECYELLEAMDEDRSGHIVEELGDVVFHMAFQIHLGEEEGAFDRERVYRTVIEKLIRRHPHVFGDTKVSGAGEVLDKWQEIKRAERKGEDASALDGVPKEMPALSYSQAIQQRAAGVGFDWEDASGVMDKVTEELSELSSADSPEEKEAELGDLLFSIVNASRWMGIDAEGALRGAGTRFRGRFAVMEQLCRDRGTPLETLALDAKEALWQESKRLTA
jgi:tetrapyrrole methylase family protein/MazG family protein